MNGQEDPTGPKPGRSKSEAPSLSEGIRERADGFVAAIPTDAAP